MAAALPKSFAKVAATPLAVAQPPTVSAPQSKNTPQSDAESAALAIDDLSINSSSAPPVTTSNSCNGRSGKAKSAGESDDSNPTDSSDVGTKPPSIDGKSITSGTTTTFAMDEKDSLRPDDSASVQAAADDDDASIRGSLIAGSRAPPMLVPGGKGIDGRIAGAGGQIVAPVNSLDNIYQQAPDDKLLEAIKNVKDRQFLLKLELEVINFVQESKEPYMDLPPSNSFFRMLTHKLADYYHMTHSYEKDHGPGFVRIFRTPFCRVPPSLASITASTRSPSPPPPMVPMKIMRRGEEVEPALSSANQSKAASEVGSDQKDKAATRERRTREEREEAYQEARKRIFGASATTSAVGTPAESVADPTDASENDVSRASSVSAKEKNSTVKRNKNTKPRRDSAGFESRSSYVQQWSQHPQVWGQPQYVSMNQAYPTPGPGQPGFSAPVAMAANGAMSPPGPPCPQPSGYNMPGRYGPPPPQPGVPGPAYGMNSNMPPPQHWPQYGPQQYRQTPQYGRPGSSSMGPPHSQYQFGQLPQNMNPYDAKPQHPIPGSYSRNGFSPKTNSFYPHANGPPNGPIYPNGPPPVPMNYSQYPPHAGYQQQYPPGPSYPRMMPMGMSNYGSNYGPNHGPNHGSYCPPPPPPPQAHNQIKPQGVPAKPPGPKKPLIVGSGTEGRSELPKYGNPESLPAKPQ